MILRYLLVVFLLFSALEGNCQDTGIDKKTTYWTRAYLEFDLNDNIQLDLELENRRFIEPHSQLLSLGRFTLLAKQNSWMTLGTGLAYTMSYSERTNIVQPEIRPHQEVNLTHKTGDWDFSHRIRLEQEFTRDTTRIISNGEVEESLDGSYSFNFRSRYKAEAECNLIKKEKNRDIGPESQLGNYGKCYF